MSNNAETRWDGPNPFVVLAIEPRPDFREGQKPATGIDDISPLVPRRDHTNAQTVLDRSVRLLVSKADQEGRETSSSVPFSPVPSDDDSIDRLSECIHVF